MSGEPDVQRIAEFTKTWRSVMLTEVWCMLTTIAMLARKAITMPTRSVGRIVVFSDGTASEIYRETAMRKRQFDDLLLLVVRFRLRFIGNSRLWHFLFRVESLLNTLLFAAHRGFETKLWLTDRTTGYYRGIYEWRGQEAAVEYLETLRVVLAPWVQTGSFAYKIVDGISREEYIEGRLGYVGGGLDNGWWRPATSTVLPTFGGHCIPDPAVR